jgi:hypothetical protein
MQQYTESSNYDAAKVLEKRGGQDEFGPSGVTAASYNEIHLFTFIIIKLLLYTLS